MFANILKASNPLDDEVSITANVQTCDGCLFREDGLHCAAFPDGIPPAILLGVFDHHKTYVKDGYDDQGITFKS